MSQVRLHFRTKRLFFLPKMSNRRHYGKVSTERVWNVITCSGHGRLSCDALKAPSHMATQGIALCPYSNNCIALNEC